MIEVTSAEFEAQIGSLVKALQTVCNRHLLGKPFPLITLSGCSYPRVPIDTLQSSPETFWT
jgi:hypothetical protein